jgi:hypothetical protein
VDSYSDVAFLASLARWILANCALASCLLGFSAISPSFSVSDQSLHCHSSLRGKMAKIRPALPLIGALLSNL